MTADVSIADTAQAAEYFLSDGVIVTGSSTNVPADTDELKGIYIYGGLHVPTIMITLHIYISTASL